MKNEIIKLRKEGKTINEIIEILGCAKSTISYHINKKGLGGKIKKESKLEIKEIIKNLRLDLKTYDEIIKLTDISKDKLKKILRELNLNKPVNHLGIKLSLNKDEVIEFYLSCKSLRKTAKNFKIDRTTLRTHYISDDLVVSNKINKPKKKKSENVINWRNRTKDKLVEYKGGKCEICGYNKSNQVLQFHHINPIEKDFTISGKSYSFEKLKLEVDKCVLVCANCHGEIHAKLINLDDHIK